MQRRLVFICAGLIAVTIGLGGFAFRVWQKQELVSLARAGIPAMPDLSRWPPEFAAAIRSASWPESEPDLAASLGRLAVLYHANGLAAEAQQTLETLRRLQPHSARWAYLLADLKLRENNPTQAEQELRATVRLNPNYAPAWLHLGDLLAGRDAFPEAGDCYAKAAALAPENLRIRFAVLAFQASQGGAAAGDTRNRAAALTKTNPGIKQLHDLLAGLHARAGDAGAAAAERRRAEEAKRYVPNDDPWIDELNEYCFDPNRLGLTGYKLSREWRLPEAEKVFQRAIKLAPTEVALRDSLCHVYELMGRLPEARAVLEKAVEECPDSPKLRVQLARILRLQQQPEPAAAVIRTALARWPADAEMHQALGLALRDAKNPAAALPEFREAVRLDPTSVEAQYNLGYCLLVAGQRAAARGAVEKALAMRPEYPEALLFLGSLALEERDVRAAEGPVTRLYRLRPDDTDARLLFATLQLLAGGAAEGAGELTRAENHYRAGLEAAPEFVPLVREQGLLALKLNQPAAAAEAFDRYVRLEPADPEGYILWGKSLKAAGRIDEARKIFQRGLEAASRSGPRGRAQAEELRQLLAR